jgi:rhodanese-related sulfurtransferase
VKLKLNCPIALASTLWLLSLAAGKALEPASLKARLDAGENITVIDVRSPVHYQRGHIPGAINIPAELVPEKKLPRVGQVVVCDDGLARDSAGLTAVSELNKKPGIQAVLLEGGYAAWEATHAPTTKARGLHPEDLHLISYDQLKKAGREQMVLIDLRRPRPQVRQSTTGSEIPQPPLTDLRQAFPNLPVTKSPFNLPQLRQSAPATPSAQPVLVLIDDGDGAAQEMARTLKANGVQRVVILAGGELILSRGGQPGLQRSGGGDILPTPVHPEPEAN